MKKMNKKGFTLAELLIVIAIIAILIAIAIPAFGGALENAKRQTDHANMRSAYALAQAANLNGCFYDETGAIDNDLTTATKLFFQQDGTLAKTSGTGDYVLKVSHVSTDANCTASIACKATTPATTVGTAKIYLEKVSGLWTVKLGAGA